MCEMCLAEQQSWKEASGSWMSHLKEYGKEEPDIKNRRVQRTLKNEGRKRWGKINSSSNLQDIEEA